MNVKNNISDILETSTCQLVSVSGGYWTGSSAVVDLLKEHRDCQVVPDEFSLFSYGELFKEILKYNRNYDPEKLKDMVWKLINFGKSESIIPFKSVARRISTSVNLYHPMLFVRKTGMNKMLGSKYKTAAYQLSTYIEETITSKKDFNREILAQKIERLLHLAFKSSQNLNQNPEAKIGVFDQLVAPTYMKYSNEIYSGIKYIFVDRDWKDQYSEIKDALSSIKRKNITLKTAPLDEDLSVEMSTIEYFYQIRSLIDKARNDTSGCENTLWINFEDLVLKKDSVVNKIFHFLDLDKSKWNEYSHFDETISVKNIGKWKTKDLDDEIKILSKYGLNE